MSDYSYISNAHPSFIDAMYQQYKQDPNSVEQSWRTFFQGFEFGANGHADQITVPTNGVAEANKLVFTPKELQVIGLINGYRRRGHLLSKTNPILDRKDRKPHLDLEDFGLTDSDLNQRFLASREIGLEEGKTLGEIIDRLNAIYCGNIGLEYFYIAERKKRRWLRQRLESFNDDDYGFGLDKKRRIFEKLNEAVLFESFLNKKYVGQKRFSLEGGESLIPALDAIVNKGAELGVEI